MLRNTCNHHANGRITESQIFIYNRGKEIPLTYLLHLHCACISINIISGLSCEITIPEHSGTFQNIPEHKKIKIFFYEKMNN